MSQEQEIVDRLRCTFEVVVVEEGGDYSELLDRHQPDLSLFEVKAAPSSCAPLVGVRENVSVPKAMLIRSDAMCYTRPLVLQNVEALGIDACFAVDSLYAYYFEELRDRLFYMPHSVDPGLFKDYRLPKTDVVTFFGHFLPSRPWRIEAAAHLRRSFPCTFFPHDTSRTTKATTRMHYGEAYARRINSSMFVPVEGGFHHGITRKFFEVPACRTCLVVPRIEDLVEYGFSDMENCVVGDPAELRDKIQLLLADEARYESVVTASQRLIRQRHVHEKRTQLHDWLVAFLGARPGEVVRQRGIFEGFETVPSESLVGGAGPTRSELPFDQFLIRRAERAIREGRLDEAERDLTKCMNLLYARHFSEPRFYLALVRLLQGRGGEAIYFLVSNYVRHLAPRGSRLLDPREAAFLIVAYCCLDQQEKAIEVARLHRELYHPELRWAKALAGAHKSDEEFVSVRSLFSRMRLDSFGTWAEFVKFAALAHGQPGIISSLETVE